MKHKIWQILLTLLFLLLLGGVALAVSAEQAATLNNASADDDLAGHAAPNAATSYTTVVTVTTTSDTSGDSLTATCYYDGSGHFSATPCSFRRALVEAKARPPEDRPILIAFDIPISDTNYSLVVSGTWTMMIDAALPALTTAYLPDRDNGLTTIDGDTQPGGRTDGPKIIFLDSDDSDITDYSLEVESGQNTIRNISWRGGGTIFLKEVSGKGGYNTVENVWIGLSDDGQEIAFRNPSDPKRLGTGGGVYATSDGNTIQDNFIAGAFALAIDIDGSDNVVQGNFVGTRANGTVPPVSAGIKCVRSLTFFSSNWYGGWGIGISGSQNQVISNTIAGLHQMQTENETPPIALDIYGSDHLIQYNVIGRDGDGSDVGVCGQGIKVAGDSTEILDNVIVDSRPGFTDASNNNPTKGAIFVNDSSPTFGQITMRRNIIITSTEKVIEFGPAIPAALRLFEPAQITLINGTAVEGANGTDSHCPGCLIDIYLDNRDATQDALEWLTSATADTNGDFSATLPRELNGDEGLRTSSTSQGDAVIGSYGLGTTTKLSELYIPADSSGEPTSLEIAGPVVGQLGVSQPFTITVFPVSVTLPLTYSMVTDGGTPAVVPPTSIDSRIVSLSGGITWDSVGVKTVRVMAANESGIVTGTHTILITDTVPTLVAPETVTIDGPTSGQIGLPYTFTVTVDPENVTTPISYEVQYTDGTATLGPFSLDQRIINTPDVTWTSAGTKTISITATNEQGFAVGVHEIVIGEEPVDDVKVFLPLVLRNHGLTFIAVEYARPHYHTQRK